MNRRTLNPTPAVVIAEVEVCTGDVCTIEEARGTASNARRDIDKMINNLKMHAFYLHSDKTKSLNINQLKYDEVLSQRLKKDISIKVLNYQIKYITPERYTVKRVNIRNNYWVQARDKTTGKIISNEKWSSVPKEIDIEESIQESAQTEREKSEQSDLKDFEDD